MTLHVAVEGSLRDSIPTGTSTQRRQLVYKALQNAKQMTRFDDVSGVNPVLGGGRLNAGTDRRGTDRGTGLWHVVVVTRKRVLSEALCRHIVTKSGAGRHIVPHIIHVGKVGRMSGGDFVEGLLLCPSIWNIIQAVWDESQRPKAVVIAFVCRLCSVVVALTGVVVLGRGLRSRGFLEDQSVGDGAEDAASALDGTNRRWWHEPQSQVVVSGTDGGWRGGWLRSRGSIGWLTVLPLLQVTVHLLVDSGEGLDARVVRYSSPAAM